ncbi:MAG TPA: hypothetical protein VFS23_32365 [Vicinamibacterales bacterium]|nr:hypothetical protein [Vicinamibacterales bacterium]
MPRKHLAAMVKKDNFEKTATGLRAIAWLWIVGAAVAYATQLDLTSVLAAEISGIVAAELLGAAAIVVGPGSLGLALSFVIERISYLAADVNLF